jgi:predicted acylesterase/phospholipase RssA
MVIESAEPPKRGLVIQGGGAKGAFALGCMQAFRDNNIVFSAVSGTSAGGLCAIIFSTGRLDEGVKAWKEIDHGGFFGRRPEGCFRRLIKFLCVMGKLFASYIKNVEPEGRPNNLSDIFFSLLVGVFAWLLLSGMLPTWLWIVSLILIPVVGFCAFANELPVISWDSRVRELIVSTITFVAQTRLLVSLTWMLLLSAGLVTIETHITWWDVLDAGAVLAMVRLPIKIQTTLMEGKLRASHISGFLSSELQMPTYVTVAEERPPNSPHFLLPTPGVFKANYVALHKAPEELKAAFAYASAALPFGILPHVVIGGKTFVDGGVADNTPLLPLLMENIDEVYVINLRPALVDFSEHIRNVTMQAIFADGPSRFGKAFGLQEERLKQIKIINLAPSVSLGGLLTGTLNFNRRQTEACRRHGYRVTTRSLRRQEAENAAPPRIYNPQYGLLTTLKLLRRAMPPCTMWNLFVRSDVGRGETADFHIPNDVRPPPGGEGSAAWSWSVMVLWTLLITDSVGSEHLWKHAIWYSVISLMMLAFPTWWARMKRNTGL